MDRSPTPAQSLSPSFDAIIRASVAAAVQHHLSSINRPSNTQMEEAITAVLDREVSPLRDSLDAKIDTAVIAALDQRLKILSTNSDTHFTNLVEAEMERRFGPVGTLLNAHIVFNIPQSTNTASTKQHGLVKPQVAPAAPSTIDHIEAAIATPHKVLPEVKKGRGAGPSATDRVLSVVITQPTITPELKREQSKEPELSYHRFVGGVEVVNVKAAAGIEVRSTSPTSDKTTLPHTLDSIENATSPFDERPIGAAKEFLDAVEEMREIEIDIDPQEDDLEGSENSIVDPNGFKTQPPEYQVKVEERKANKTSLKGKPLNPGDEKEGEGGGEEPLFVEQDEVFPEPRTKRGAVKRKADTVDGRSISVDTGSPAPKKVRKQRSIPGHTDGPPVTSLKATNRLTAVTNCRGYPRIVDVNGFTKETNKQKLTMAEIVATVLCNHSTETLNKFLDLEDGFAVNFVRWEALWEKNDNVKHFCIQRVGAVVKCGYLNTKKAIILPYWQLWNLCYVYRIEASGRWVPEVCHRHLETSIDSKKSIENLAATYDSLVLCNKIWLEGDVAKIEVNVDTDATIRKNLEFKIGPGYGKERRSNQSTKGEDGQNEGSKGDGSTHSGTKVLVS